MQAKKSLHSICRWTFHGGKGGFVPAHMRPQWEAEHLNTVAMIKLVREKIAPRLPAHIELGVELHYDSEVHETTADEIAEALQDAHLSLAMITPGLHGSFAYGGPAALDDKERKAAEEFGLRTVDIAYGALKKAWHADKEKVPTFVLWNGSYGYDLASLAVKRMYKNLKKSVAALCRYEEKKGGLLYIGIEPKPNEGHPALLLPTVASALLFWRRLEEEFGIRRLQKGVNKEFGHSEMIGLDPVYDTVEELDCDAMVHMHINSQGYSDGIILGGPGKYDIDHGARINGMNIAIAGLLQEADYRRWKGHDMQVRPYDNEEQGIDRVLRSILSWEACEKAATDLDVNQLYVFLERRETAKAEDMIRAAVVDAHHHFLKMYRDAR